MYKDRITLTDEELLNYEFKIDTRGYRPQEVDKILDIVIEDYRKYNKKLKEQENELNELIHVNSELRQEVRKLKTKLDVIKSNTNTEVNNSDLLRRLSNLEKIIYGKE